MAQRVNVPIDRDAEILAKVWGMTPRDLCIKAMEMLVDQTISGPWHNIETFTVAYHLKTDPRWIRLAEDCDDYAEFLRAAKLDGIEFTPIGQIPIQSRSIARGRLAPIIRATRKDKK